MKTVNLKSQMENVNKQIDYCLCMLVTSNHGGSRKYWYGRLKEWQKVLKQLQAVESLLAN